MVARGFVDIIIGYQSDTRILKSSKNLNLHTPCLSPVFYTNPQLFWPVRA